MARSFWQQEQCAAVVEILTNHRSGGSCAVKRGNPYIRDALYILLAAALCETCATAESRRLASEVQAAVLEEQSCLSVSAEWSVVGVLLALTPAEPTLSVEALRQAIFLAPPAALRPAVPIAFLCCVQAGSLLKCQQALEIAYRAIVCAGIDPRLMATMADIHLRMGNGEAAKEIGQQGLKAFGPSPLWHYQLGIAARKEGMQHNAIKHFKEAHVLQPRNSLFLYRLGILFMELEQYEPAAETLTAAVRLSPEEPEIRFKLAQTCAYRRDRVRALQEYSAALDWCKTAEQKRTVRRRIDRLLSGVTHEPEALSSIDGSLWPFASNWLRVPSDEDASHQTTVIVTSDPNPATDPRRRSGEVPESRVREAVEVAMTAASGRHGGRGARLRTRDVEALVGGTGWDSRQPRTGLTLAALRQFYQRQPPPPPPPPPPPQ